MTRHEAGERVNQQRESWNRERTLSDKRTNNDCVTESAMLLAARATLFQPKGKPGTELSTILTMFSKRKMLSEWSRESIYRISICPRFGAIFFWVYQLRKLDVFLHSIIGLKRKKANASCLTRIKPDPIAFSACPLSVRGVGVGVGGVVQVLFSLVVS